VVANGGVGDMAVVIQDNNVGVIVEGASEQQMLRAFQSLQELMADPELPARCRATAESIFSLATGTDAYHEVYSSILNQEYT